MTDRDNRVIAGVLVGAVIVWLLMRRRACRSGATMGAIAASSGGCGCHGAPADRRLCPPTGQTSQAYQHGYSQAPGVEYVGAYGTAGSIEVTTPGPSPFARPVPQVYHRTGSVQGDRDLAALYGYGGKIAS